MRLKSSVKSFLSKGSAQGKLRIVKNDIRQLDDRLHYRLIPVFLACFDHPVRKTMQGNIEDMATAFKPGREPAQSMMMLQEENLVSAIGETVGCRQSAETGTYDDDIVSIFQLGK